MNILTYVKFKSQAKFWVPRLNFNLRQISDPCQVFDSRKKSINPYQNYVNPRDPLDPCNFLTYDTHYPTQLTQITRLNFNKATEWI